MLKVAVIFLDSLIVIAFLNSLMENKKLGINIKTINIIFFIIFFIYLSEKILFKNVTRISEIGVVFCLSFIYLLFFKNGKLVEKIFWIIFMQAILIATSFISIGGIAIIYHKSFSEIFFATGIRIPFSILFSKFFQGVIFYYLIKKNFSFKYSTSIIFSFICGFTIVMTSLIIFISLKELESSKMLDIQNFIIMLILLTTVIFEVYVLDIFSSQVENMLVSEMKVKELDSVKRHGEELYTIFEKIKGWQHDWNNHLAVIKFLIDEKEYLELEKYIERVSSEIYNLKKETSIIKTKNVVLDAIINSKIVLAKNLDIDINVNINLPDKIPFTNLELCVLLGNLLDNSIEANLGENKNKWINVKIDVLKDNLSLSIDNSINNIIINQNGKYLTSKGKSDHGRGLIQIDNIVNKYNGNIIRKSEGKIFTTKILIPITIDTN